MRILLAWLLSLGLATAASSAAAEETPSAARLDRQGDALPANVLSRFGTVRWRHGAPITRLVFGPEDRTLVSASEDGTVRVWDRQAGKELRRFPTTPVLALSPNGTLLATLDRENVVHLWDLVTGKELRQIKGPKAGASGPLVFAADGKTLAWGPANQIIIVWATDTGKEMGRIKGPPPPPNAPNAEGFSDFVLSPDGKLLAASVTGVDKDKNPVTAVKLYDVSTGKERHAIDTGQFSGHALTFSPDGKRLAFARVVKIHIFDTATGKEVRAFEGGNGFSTGALVFTPDGKALAVSDPLNHMTQLLDVETGKLLRDFGDRHWLGSGAVFVIYRSAGTATDMAISADGKLLAQALQGNTIRLWEIETGKELPQVTGHRATVSTVIITPDGKTLLTWSDDRTVRRWDLATSQEAGQFAVPNGTLCLAFAPDGKTAAVGLDNKSIRLLDATAGKELHKLAEHAGGVSVVAFSPDGKLLAARGSDNLIRLLDAATGKELRRIIVPKDEEPEGDPFSARLLSLYDPTLGLAFAPDGKTVVSQAAKNTLRLWEVETGQEVRQIPLRQEGVTSFAFAPDGRTLAVENSDRTVSVYEIASGKERARLGKAKEETDDPLRAQFVTVFFNGSGNGDKAAVPTLAFSPDGRILATRGPDRKVHLWDVVSGKEVRQLPGHQGEIATLAFGPGGRTLLSGSHDTTALLWDVADLTKRPQTAPVELQPAQVEALWNELGGKDAALAYQTINQLVAAPKPALAFLDKQVQPTPSVEAAKLDQRIADLNAEKFAVRQQAKAELEKLGTLARPALVKILAGQPSLETRQRVEGVLREIVGGSLTSEQLREVRAVEVLERIGTTEARQVLQKLARGAAGARQTDAAQAALERPSR